MGRKIITLVIVTSLVLALAAGCGGKNTDESTAGSAGNTSQAGTSTQESTPAELSEVSVTVFRPMDISQDYNDEIFTRFIKEKFNMNLKAECTPSSSYQEKLSLLFATGEYPDAIDFVGTTIINKLASDGFILPLNDYADKLRNYIKAFKPEDWDGQVKRLSNSEGKWFVLEYKQPENALGSNIWTYRLKEFEKLGLAIPKTTDDIYNAMKAFKKVNPNATIPNRWGPLNAIEGFNMAFRVQVDIWIDPDVNDLVYGPATDKFRELMKYMARLYKEGLLSKEFATMTSSQRNAQLAKGNVYINYQFPGAEEGLNQLLQNGKHEPDWGRVDDSLLITAYPDKQPMQQKYKIAMDFGTAITDRLQGEALDRYLSYLDWCTTEEGQIFQEFGVKGETYDIVDGKPQYIGKAMDETDPKSYLGLIQNLGPFGYYLVQNEAHAVACYPAYLNINKILANNEHYDYTPLAFRYTAEEEKVVANAGTIINDIRDEYILKFIMGTKDPNNDADWKEYMDKLNQAGLDKYLVAKKAAYDRINK